MDRYDEALLRFLWNNPSPYHIAAAQAEQLRETGYEELSERETWKLVPGGKYFLSFFSVRFTLTAGSLPLRFSFRMEIIWL